MNKMSKLLTFLQQKPAAGLASTAAGSALPWIEAMSPFLQFIGLCTGLVIGGLTIYSLLLKIRYQRSKRKEQ